MANLLQSPSSAGTSRVAKTRSRGRAGALDLAVVRALLHRLGQPAIRFVLWDGSAVGGEGCEPVAEVLIQDRTTLWRLARLPEFEFGEAYSAGRLAIRGDLLALLEFAYRAPEATGRLRALARIFRPRPGSNDPASSRENIHRHYDLGNDFYALWLDREMIYTCAYYSSPEASLEEAQIAKMEHVCRKLQLRPGQRVVEAGSGWGALALYMARHYGVTVKSYNLSGEQVAFARKRLKEEGLQDRVEFVHADYREIEGRYDVFVSVGMLEHVGVENYDALGRLIARSLEPGGLGLIHTIGRDRPRPLNAWIARRIFPGAEPPTTRQMMELIEQSGLSLLDLENLRMHYALTLQEWLRRFEAHETEVAQSYGEPFVRAWRLYLTGSIAAFRTGSLQLIQVLFQHRTSPRFPMSRAHLYQAGEESETPWNVATSW